MGKKLQKQTMCDEFYHSKDDVRARSKVVHRGVEMFRTYCVTYADNT